MLPTQLIHMVIHSIELILILSALYVAKRAYETSPRKVIDELLEVLDRLEVKVDRNEGKWKKLNANYALILARQKANGLDTESDAVEPDQSSETSMKAGETPEQWKARMRQQIAAGSLKHK